LHDRALNDLSFIRRTMERAASFTDVPGWGLVASGAIAVGAAAIAARQPTPERWLAVWLVAAVVAASVGGAGMRAKMRRRQATDGGPPGGVSLPARKFLLGFWPAIVAGALLTVALADPGTAGVDRRVAERVLPGMWLLLYGLGVTSAGAFSIRAVPLMGAVLMALGAAALFAPALDGDVAMALGFGVTQVAFGWHIARRHGG
jgi:hypothetical protein